MHRRNRCDTDSWVEEDVIAQVYEETYHASAGSDVSQKVKLLTEGGPRGRGGKILWSLTDFRRQ
ncbi:hypothetical protein INR49_025119, partial [Caranx melampygus]